MDNEFRSRPWTPSSLPEYEASAGPKELTVEIKPRHYSAGYLMISTFLVGIFGWLANGDDKAFTQSHGALFMGSCVGIMALGFLIVSIRAFLADRNAVPKLTLEPDIPRLGGILRVSWEWKGKTGKIRKLRIFLRGHEEATYIRRDETHTSRAVFRVIDAVNTGDLERIVRGDAEIVIPTDTIHSIGDPRNTLIWTLHVHGEIPGWPDVFQEYEMVILPMEVQA